MKIVLYLHCLSRGGTERMTTHLANYWCGQGHTITILCNSQHGSPAYPLNEGVRLIDLDVGRESANYGVAIVNNMRAVKAVRREVKQLEPDYMIAMAPTVNVTAAFATIGMDVTTIGAEQNYPPAEGLGTPWEFLRRYTYGLLDAVVSQTQTTKLWLKENTNAKTVKVIHGPVVYPLDRSDPLLIPDVNDHRKIVLSVGRLCAQKQYDHLILAFREALKSSPDWKLVILGDGELRSELEVLVQECDLDESVYLPGVAGNVGEWYEASDIFSLSSAYEGFPNVLIEALAHGLPSVCYDCKTGPSEMIGHSENGYLVPPGDINKLGNHLLKLMKDDELREVFGEKARTIVEKLSIASISAQWLVVLEFASRRGR